MVPAQFVRIEYFTKHIFHFYEDKLVLGHHGYCVHLKHVVFVLPIHPFFFFSLVYQLLMQDLVVLSNFLIVFFHLVQIAVQLVLVHGWYISELEVGGARKYVRRLHHLRNSFHAKIDSAFSWHNTVKLIF